VKPDLRKACSRAPYSAKLDIERLLLHHLYHNRLCWHSSSYGWSAVLCLDAVHFHAVSCCGILYHHITLHCAIALSCSEWMRSHVTLAWRPIWIDICGHNVISETQRKPRSVMQYFLCALNIDQCSYLCKIFSTFTCQLYLYRRDCLFPFKLCMTSVTLNPDAELAAILWRHHL